MQYQYVASAYKSSSVVASVSGAFVSETENNVILARGSRLEVYRYHAEASEQDPDGAHLQLLGEYPMHGTIETLDLFHPPDRPTAQLLVTSTKRQFAVLAWDAVAQTVCTESTGTVDERTGRASGKALVAVDPGCAMFALHVFQGVVHVFPMRGQPSRQQRGRRPPADDEPLPYAVDDAQFAAGLLVPAYVQQAAGGEPRRRGKARAHVARSSDVLGCAALAIDELRVLDMRFLHAADARLAVLHEDADGARHVRAYAVGVAHGEWEMAPVWTCAVDGGATRLEPLAGGGMVVLGDDSLMEVGGEGARGAATARLGSPVAAAAWVDGGHGSRLVVGDGQGTLWLAVLQAHRVVVERLGTAPVASSLAHVGGGVLFVGSHYGDAQLVALQTQPSAEGDYVRVLQTLDSLAPLVDFGVAAQRGGGVVACSGMRSTPALRLVRNGVGVRRLGGVALAGVQRVWAVARPHGAHAVVASLAARTLVLGLAARTLVLGWTEPSGSADTIELHELGASGWAVDEPTVAAGAAPDGCAVQVTAAGVRLIGGGDSVIAQWAAPGARISAASVCGAYVVAAGGRTLYCVAVRGAALECVAQRPMDADVACVDAHAWEDGPAHVAAGLWDGGAALLALPGLQPACALPALASSAGARPGLPRSVLLCTLGATRFLLAGMGDGRLHHVALDADGAGLRAAEHKSAVLGARPLALARFDNCGAPGVFVGGDHPAVVFAAGAGRLMYAAVDGADITCAAAIAQSTTFADALCLVSPGELWFGRPDRAQRLHVRTCALPPWTEPVHVACGATQLAVATVRAPRDAADAEESSVALMDAQTADVLGSVRLGEHETATSVCAVERMEGAGVGDVSGVFAVGTAVVRPGEDDAKSGRVLLVRWDAVARAVEVVGALGVHGAVYAVHVFRGMLLATAGSRLLLVRWQARESSGAPELAVVCSQQAQVAALALAVQGDCVLVGDIIASAALFQHRCDAGRHRLVPLARDPAALWTTAVAAVPPPLPQNHARLALPSPEDPAGRLPAYADAFRGPECARFVVADAQCNLVRMVHVPAAPAAGANIADHRLVAEARWHLGDQVNAIRPGGLVIDIPDADFPELVRPLLIFATLHGALGIVASVEDARLARVLARLQTNLAHLLPTAGVWSYDRWRAFASDQRACDAYGVLDGDLIVRFLELRGEMQGLILRGGGPAVVQGVDLVRLESARREEVWGAYAAVEGETECRCLAQLSVSDIIETEDVTVEYVRSLVESLTRLH
ncbi:DNA damage-binding protein 1a [Coemansia interrupta]|uniref:DNA damage-binding protein 1a n=1 Tax=Coemansia interrupta TaxID=1126814 RepID=A0A9W8LFU4_9FUNG|nr:DNA damage-binding protein 1a [Coemansia interrupta]